MWQKIIGWLMLLMGIIFLLIMIPGISQGALQKPGALSALAPLVFFAIANGILGFGILKTGNAKMGIVWRHCLWDYYDFMVYEHGRIPRPVL